MQTSNTENPIKNNVLEMIHTLEKLSNRLPFALVNEGFVKDTATINTIQSSFTPLISILNDISRNTQIDR
jgi:hypothetical protein